MHPTICVIRDPWVRKALISLAVLSSLSLNSLFSMAEEAHPGLGAESMYSEAVLAINQKRNEEALRILDSLLKSSPDHVEALELKALTLKTKGDDRQSLEVYEKLAQLKSPEQQGPYHFEIGILLNRQKKPGVARTHFQKAADLGFNRASSHFFLGLIDYNSGDLVGAQKNFEEVKSSGAQELRAVAHYYLGLIHYKNGYGAGGMSELLAARALAGDLKDSKMAADIRESADKILSPFNTPQWFANISVLGQYDSNVSQVPSQGTTVPSDASGKSTPKVLVSAGIGWMSSPTQTLQWVGSYRFSWNKNFNSHTRSYEFFTNIPALYINYKPLNVTTGGIKIEGNYTFQNQLKDPAISATAGGSYLYRPYNYGVEVGPFVKTRISQNGIFQAEAFFKPQRYTTNADPGLSGNAILGRASLKYDMSRLWNPTLVLTGAKNPTEATQERYTSVAAGLYNTMRVTGKATLSLSADVGLTRYTEHSLGRSDRNVSVRSSLLHQLSTNWSLLADFSYITNSSPGLESVYSFKRTMVGLGLSWTL